MKTRFLSFIIISFIVIVAASCGKQEYFKSESAIRKDLIGTWDLIPIPKFLTITSDSGTYQKLRTENWVFTETQVTITNNNSAGESGTSTYKIHTSWTKAEVEIEGVPAPLNASIYNGKWQIVRLDDEIMAIANDHDGSTGLTQLEFKKRN